MYDTDEWSMQQRIGGLADLYELDDKSHFIEELVTILQELLKAIPKDYNHDQD